MFSERWVYRHLAANDTGHVCISEHLEVHLQTTMHTKFHNPSSDNVDSHRGFYVGKDSVQFAQPMANTEEDSTSHCFVTSSWLQ